MKRAATIVLALIAAVALLLLCACGTHKNKTQPSLDDRELLTMKFETYSKLFELQTDQFGFINIDECDSTMNTALSNPSADLFAAERSDGEWLRRPTAYPECFAAGESRSTISRDMLLGVIYRCVRSSDLSCLRRMWAYGEKHSWSMGKDGWQHSIFSPDYIALLAQAIYHVSDGRYNYTARIFKFPQLTPAVGFEAQLQVLFGTTRELVYGSADSLTVDLYEALALANPDNPLMQVVAGKNDVATKLLLNIWPNDRLPTSADWCSNWRLSQAPDGKGLSACPDENKTHSGGDFLFVARLILDIEKLPLR